MMNEYEAMSQNAASSDAEKWDIWPLLTTPMDAGLFERQQATYERLKAVLDGELARQDAAQREARRNHGTCE